MGTFLIILIILFALTPFIRRWLAGFASRRAEDYLRRHMGMPPRPGSREEKRQRRQAERAGRTARGDRAYGYAGSRERDYSRHDDGPIIPREYAEDVEFTEYKDFSEETVVTGTESGTSRFRRRRKSEQYTVESQVSDAEWEEIKVKK